MKYADKKKAKFVLVLGEEEIQKDKAKLKNMITGEEKEISISVEEIRKNIQRNFRLFNKNWKYK